MAYHEQFSSGDAAGGSYQCTLTLSDPTGWTIQAGGPARAYVAPAARSYAGVAGAVGIGGAASVVSNGGIGGGMGTSASTVTVPSAQEKVRLAALNRVRKRRVLEPVEEQELLSLLATVHGIHVARLAHFTPKHSPTPAKWRDNKGRVDILPNGHWKYTDEDGNEVTYEPDEPNFDNYAIQSVKIDDMQGDCTTDFVKADKQAALGLIGPKKDSNTWHHKNDLQNMQELPSKIHSRFTHYGARSIIRKNKAAAVIATSPTVSASHKPVRKKKKS